MTNQNLTISVRDLHTLVDPVLPCASGDKFGLPILSAVHIYTRDKWLIAEATDRFRIAVQRQAAGEGEWPAWEAVVPRDTLRALFEMFKPTRGFDPEVSLTVVDAFTLNVEMVGGISGGLFTEARVAYPLVSGDYPKFASIITEAIAAEPGAGDRRFNWQFLSSFKVADPRGTGLTIRAGAPNKPILVSDDENFIGIIMPRKAPESGAIDLSAWTEILSPPAPTPAKSRGKRAAAKTPEAVAS